MTTTDQRLEAIDRRLEHLERFVTDLEQTLDRFRRGMKIALPILKRMLG